MTAQCTVHKLTLPEGRVGACPRCLLQGDLPTAILAGHIELGEEIGRGGMGAVFKAKDLKLGRTVAVKLLPAELASQESFSTRFDREARALAMLNHPNIVAVHATGVDEGQSYIVMEYVDGESLEKLMPMSVERAVPIGLQICDALAYAHAQGVVHRDVKPANILIDAAGRVKVTDFGIARIVNPDGHGWTATRTDELIGTPHYMAPEALRGATPDPRMDVYSLGVLLYEMVTGHLPVGDFEPPPSALEAVICRALSPEAARRYQSIDEMRRELLNPATGLPPDEELWIRAVAILQSISTGVAIYAFLQSVTPKIQSRGEMLPLIVIKPEELPNGQLRTLARFEIWWTFAALATFAVAITAYGFLRRHWRQAGLERPQPETRIVESRFVLTIGLIACVVYGVRLLLEWRGLRAAEYIPIAGAAIEIAALYYLWITILKCWRVSRPLRREPLLWIGFAIALLPPVANLVTDLMKWNP